MLNNKKMCLIDAQQIEFQSKKSGEGVIKKWKYIFFNDKNEIVEGYLDTNEYALEVIPNCSAFDISKAKEYPFQGRIFDKKLVWRLISRSEVLEK